MASDARLLRASLNGDHDAFARIVRRYQSLVCAVTYSGTGDLAASEDLAQETFLTAWRRLSSLREPSRLRAWLCTIARNLTTDHLRRRQWDIAADAASIEDAPAVAGTLPTPAEQAAAREHERLVWSAVHEIPETYRVPLVLYYREQHSVRRVAQAMGLSRSAVKHRLVRARAMVKGKLAALVDDTLSASAPGSAFGAAVLAGLGVTAAKKGAGVGSTIFGLSLAKAAVITAVAAAVIIAGGVSVRRGTEPRAPLSAKSVAPTGGRPGIPAWYLLRQTDAAAFLLAPLVVQMANVLDPAAKSSPMWHGKPQGNAVKLNLRVEAEASGEIVVGFFERSDWLAPPACVRSFRGPGQYVLHDVPPGEYALGAVMGMPREAVPEAGIYDSLGQMQNHYPRPTALGVHESWPRTVEVARGGEMSISVLVSPEFENLGTIQNPCILSWMGKWKTMDPEWKVTVRTVDGEGREVPFCRVRRFDAEQRTLFETGTDQDGLAYFDHIGGPFTLWAQHFDFVPETLTDRYQLRRFGQVFQAHEKPVVTFKWDPFPAGSATLGGRVLDQHGHPLKEYYLRIESKEGEPQGDGPYYVASQHLPVVDPEGRFRMEALAPGEYKARVRAFDYQTHVWDDEFQIHVPDGEGTTVECDLVVEAKELLYGRATYRDGTPVRGEGWTAWFEKYDQERMMQGGGWPGRHFSFRIQPDGFFRVCLSRQEREDLLANSGGMIELRGEIDGKLRELGQVHVDELSHDPVAPALVVCSLAADPDALRQAAREGDVAEVARVLAEGIDVNAGDDARRTPLHLAAEAGHRAVVEALLAAGADVNPTDLKGRTPTGLAALAGHDDVADLLREHGGVE